MLEPESRITIRFRREGRVRELPVTVVPEPLDIRRRREAFRTVRGPTAVARTFDVPPFERTSPPVPGTRPLAPGAPGAPGAPAPVTLSLPPRLAMAPTGVVGAQMVTLTDGLAKAIGQRGVRGVLVTDVPLGSPAFESGLRDGDIITRVGGRDIRTLTELRDRVGRAAENGEPAVEVDVMRERRAVKLILRW